MSVYDIAVIGGGIHGAGAAQAAAAAGYSVLLLEKTDWAAGTSSCSSKLIHGGLRYLESGQFPLVYESLRERRYLLRNAPELVHRIPFYIPVYRSTSRGPWTIALGLSLYALLGLLSRNTRFRKLPKDEWSLLKGLLKDDLQAVYQYWDAQTDDAALTRAVVQSAATLGATCLCPATVTGVHNINGHYEVRAQYNNEWKNYQARSIVNAAGPWVNEVLAMTSPKPTKRDISLVQGAHIIIDVVPPRGVFYVEAPDRRAVLVMPWKGRTLIGTTETEHDASPETCRPRQQEIEYLLNTYKQYFPAEDIEILESFAGLRVLPDTEGSAFHRPRETILHSDPQQPAMITLYGGKLTTYRATAAKAIKKLKPFLPPRQACADTRALALTPVKKKEFV